MPAAQFKSQRVSEESLNLQYQTGSGDLRQQSSVEGINFPNKSRRASVEGHSKVSPAQKGSVLDSLKSLDDGVVTQNSQTDMDEVYSGGHGVPVRTLLKQQDSPLMAESPFANKAPMAESPFANKVPKTPSMGSTLLSRKRANCTKRQVRTYGFLGPFLGTVCDLNM